MLAYKTCTYFKKAEEEEHCPFSVVCKDECIFSLLCLEEFYDELCKDYKELEYELSNYVSEDDYNELQDNLNEAESTVETLTEQIEDLKNLFLDIPTIIENNNTSDFITKLQMIDSFNNFEIENIIEEFKDKKILSGDNNEN